MKEVEIGIYYNGKYLVEYIKKVRKGEKHETHDARKQGRPTGNTGRSPCNASSGGN